MLFEQYSEFCKKWKFYGVFRYLEDVVLNLKIGGTSKIEVVFKQQKSPNPSIWAFLQHLAMHFKIWR